MLGFAPGQLTLRFIFCLVAHQIVLLEQEQQAARMDTHSQNTASHTTRIMQRIQITRICQSAAPSDVLVGS
jgi:hypothetical protein